MWFRYCCKQDLLARGAKSLAVCFALLGPSALSGAIQAPTKEDRDHPLPGFALGKSFFYRLTVDGVFTSYGGKETPIHSKVNCMIKVVRVNETENRLKFGFWTNRVGGEPL